MDTFELTNIHLQLLRKLHVSWETTEVGAPIVEPAAPYGSTQLYDDVAELLGLPVRGEMEEPEPDALKTALGRHGEIRQAFEILLEHHGLEPGSYGIEDRPAFLHQAGRLSWSTVDVRVNESDSFSQNRLIRFFQIFKSVWTARRQMERAEDAGPQPVAVDITEDHLKLLAHLYPRWHENEDRATVVGKDPSAQKLQSWIDEERLYPVPGFDAKRPYGERTDFTADMAEILGWTTEGADGRLSDDQEQSLIVLHHDMQMVVQAVVQHGRPAEGTYRLSDLGWQMD